MRFFALAEAKLAPGGVFIAETVNPHSIAASKAFWVDPTHRNPIFPEVAAALAGSPASFRPDRLPWRDRSWTRTASRRGSMRSLRPSNGSESTVLVPE